MTDQALDRRLAKFFKFCAEQFFDGRDIDGGAAQDKAAELGLLIKTTYDPAVHGEHSVVEPGDDYYVYADDVRMAVADKR